MNIFHFGVATEANDYYNDMDAQIWIRTDDGKLVLMEDDGNESD